MPLSGFEPSNPATKRPQTYALDRAATEVGTSDTSGNKCLEKSDGVPPLFPQKLFSLS
jgi:hypothetical protein